MWVDYLHMCAFGIGPTAATKISFVSQNKSCFRNEASFMLHMPFFFHLIMQPFGLSSYSKVRLLCKTILVAPRKLNALRFEVCNFFVDELMYIIRNCQVITWLYMLVRGACVLPGSPFCSMLWLLRMHVKEIYLYGSMYWRQNWCWICSEAQGKKRWTASDWWPHWWAGI